uniref:Uncharacterized protein n=1 Tax=Anguilla anguilla TaxID=7936 RepID=A0A0E9UQF7_ANGAN
MSLCVPACARSSLLFSMLLLRSDYFLL